MTFHVPNKLRVREGAMGSDDSIGNNGAFIIELKHQQRLRIIASDAIGWEHVSVSRKDRCPTWDEMCQVKDLFWDKTDTVVQFHPPESEYVNNHRFCLHLWRKVGHEFETPPALLVGVKGAGTLKHVA